MKSLNNLKSFSATFGIGVAIVTITIAIDVAREAKVAKPPPTVRKYSHFVL